MKYCLFPTEILLGKALGEKRLVASHLRKLYKINNTKSGDCRDHKIVCNMDGISFIESRIIALFGLALILSGCTTMRPGAPSASVVEESQPLSIDSRQCSGSFVPHRLPHVTRSDKERIGLYQGHGAGVALADLNEDGRIDIILAGQHAPSNILWNQGGLKFRSEPLDADGSRAVNAVDVDSDGRIDLVFTHSGAPPSFWRAGGNPAQPDFTRVAKQDFINRQFPFVMAWGDLDDDGDLDMVGGSYDRELNSLGLGSIFAGTPVGGGVYLYTNERGSFKAFLLLPSSEALAILLTDLDADGRRDILVGNDFAPPDSVFFNKPEGWIDAFPFARTSSNTMGFAEGDINNDGNFEIMATDMKPYAADPVWQPNLEGYQSMQSDDGIQFLANSLQSRSGSSTFSEHGREAGVDATGWSWSLQFGDMDNDGAVDIYVVNGMFDPVIFAHFPGNELVQENQALRNDGTGRFLPAPEWGLGATESGRGMSFADLDNDGDLDIVVNNLAKPSVLFENRLCVGNALEVVLHWEGSPNRRAIGAQLRLRTTQGILHRKMRVSSGYLSSVPARVHFGLGKATASDLQQLEVIWPDGHITRIAQPPLGTLLQVRRPFSTQLNVDAAQFLSKEYQDNFL